MKKCPACDKEFPDSMRFCQTDGTLLVEKVDDAPLDPYKTVVGSQSDIAAAIPPVDPLKTMVASPPPKADDDILQLPEEPDLMKTLVVSQDELNAELKSGKSEDSSPLDLPPPAQYAPSAPLIEPKPKASVSPTTPPKTDAPFSSPPPFGDVAAPKSEDATAIIDKNDVPPNPPSPFDAKPFENDFSGKSPYGNQENKPIPSPFDLSMPPGYLPPSMNPFNNQKPSAKDFDEPKQANPFDAPTPFEQPTFGSNESFNQPLQQAEWTPPPAPDASWQSQEIGANTPFQPPVAGQGLNQTLPIVSLILGIVSLCCYTGWLTGPAALITGYLGLKNIKSNPDQYGGKGLAIAGMITGGIFMLIWVIYWIFIIVVYAGLFAAGGFSR